RQPPEQPRPEWPPPKNSHLPQASHHRRTHRASRPLRRVPIPGTALLEPPREVLKKCSYQSGANSRSDCEFIHKRPVLQRGILFPHACLTRESIRRAHQETRPEACP